MAKKKKKTTRRAKKCSVERSPRKRNEALERARQDFCRSAVARERYEHEVIEEARAHPLFRNRKTGKPMSSRNIRESYLYPVRKQMRETVLDSQEEFVRAYHRLTHAFRIACDRCDPKAMALVQKTVNRMLGLRRDPVPSEAINTERLRQQLQEIHESIGGNGER